MELIGKKILKDLVDRKIGYGIVQPGQNVDNGIPVIKVNNIISGLSDVNLLDKTTVENSNKYKRTLLQGGELLISLVGSVGKTAIVPKSFSGCNLVRATGLIDIKNPLICKWTKYFIDSKYGQTYINNNLNTTIQPTLNIDSLEKMEIPFFQKEYMEKAVNILHSLDDKIELNNKINENLEQQAQALFKSWFVDFEPFGGKMPEEWNVGKLNHYCNFQEGYVNPAQTHSEYFDGNIKWLRAVDINESFIIETPRTLTQEGFESAGKSAFLFKPGSIAISKSGTVGRLGIISDYMCGNRAVIGIELKNENDLPFVQQYLKSRQKEFPDMAVGSVQKNLYVSMMEDLDILIPDANSLNQFSDICNAFYKQIKNNCYENYSLTLLRDTLLPKLMNGEIEV